MDRSFPNVDIETLLARLTLQEKIALLTGQGSFKTTSIPRHNIPSITTSDGPHGLRGARKFGRVPSVLLPSATAMGATFDVDLMRRVGNLLGDEARCKKTERTLRELHLLPFQLAYRHSNPWSIMTSYNKINGIHSSEDPLLLEKILRQEWGFNGLVMSDWWGTYSTTESINAGMDLEMPGPTQFRGNLLNIAVNTRKVSRQTLDKATRNVLNFVKKVTAEFVPWDGDPSAANTPENQALVRKVAADSIVLLKNKEGILPLQHKPSQTYGLIGHHFKLPALSGGGSAEGDPYYWVTPYDAMVDAVGEGSISYTPGRYTFKFVPFLMDLNQPGTAVHGWWIDIFGDNPDLFPNAQLVHSTPTDKDLIDIPESLHSSLPHKYFVRARAVFKSPSSSRFCFGFAVAGKGKVKFNKKEVIDLWTNQPPKMHDTPCFNRLSMERFCELDLRKDETVEVEIIMVNEDVSGGVGTAFTLAGRFGGYEMLSPEQGLKDAVRIAKSVDVPIVMIGLSADYESESSDRKHLELPPGATTLVETVLAANPSSIIVTQAGCPIEMPWEAQANTLLHAWYGGQETGNGIVDILFGQVNPTGRLSVTFPRSIRHTPTYLTFGKADYEILYGEGVFIGHRFYEASDRDPLFYFGHGLSYTRFEYSNLSVPALFEPRVEHKITVTVDVKNVGSYDGAETIQLYVHDPESTLQRPARELKAFTKVFLVVGETRTVSLELDKYALSIWSEEHGEWKAEDGVYHVIIATSANPKDEIMRGTFKLPRSFYWSGI